MIIEQELQKALQCHQAGDLQKAEYMYKEILKESPDNAHALHFSGILHYQKGDYELAIHYLKQALQYDPNNADLYNNLGTALKEYGKLDEALNYYYKAIYFNPHSAMTYNNLGTILQLKGRHDEAIANYVKALQMNPNLADAYFNIGTAVKEKGYLSEAMEFYEKAVHLNPDFIEAYLNLGIAFQENHQMNDAVACFQKALQIDPHYPEAHCNMSFVYLLTGNFEEGWKEYEWRRRLKGSVQREFSQPLWDGSDIHGKTILLYAEQGFGDTIQFIRYIPFVAQKNAIVLVECQEELASVIQDIEGVNRVFVFGEQLPEFDVHCPLLSLPLVFDTTLETIPAEVPYIKADSILVQRWKNKLKHDNSKLKIGLSWAGRPTHKRDRQRSISFDTFSPLLQINEVTFYSLQKGEAAGQTKNHPVGMRLIDYTEEMRDFSDTAAFIENLDLIISVDTAVAHLAGALGKPVWTLLPFAPDWRWMLHREDCPWYPTMRLFRQPSPGDWGSVINNVLRNLELFIRDEDR